MSAAAFFFFFFLEHLVRMQNAGWKTRNLYIVFIKLLFNHFLHSSVFFVSISQSCPYLLHRLSHFCMRCASSGLCFTSVPAGYPLIWDSSHLIRVIASFCLYAASLVSWLCWSMLKAMAATVKPWYNEPHLNEIYITNYFNFPILMHWKPPIFFF